MPRRIVVLSEEVANQIAAGEVVERPASIVKEMVENALDAGASDILLELEKGGLRSLRVTDNGSGIEREDVALVFERHATSKIMQMEDIFSAGSFGFRGEAMASIASVAHVELLTRRSDDIEGTKAVAQAGKILEITPAGLPSGTQITVTELFANVPARRKFLKTETAEQSACLDTITRLALAHPEIRFRVRVDGKETFAAPPSKDITGRMAKILGEDFIRSCLEVGEQKKRVNLKGFISHPAVTRYNSKNIYLYVNCRFIRDTSLTHALLAAYRQVIEPRRYPAACMFLDLPGEEVDVNVHPAKLEVRFRHASEIYELVSQSVSRVLGNARAAPETMAYRLTPQKNTFAPSGFWRPKDVSQVTEGTDNIYSRQNLQQAITQDLLKRTENAPESYANVEINTRTEKFTFARQQYLGQFADAYLVFGGPDGMILLDQHAAHERIILERLKASGADKVISQPLLMPEVISLPPAQISLFQEALPLFAEIGLELEIFGRDAIVIKALPACLPRVTPGDLIADLAAQLESDQALPSLAGRKEKLLASLACRAAIKANTPLSPQEVSSLCRDLEKTPFSLTCPHGRPISVQFSLYEIQRMFKRK